jgi:hypothetical protein
MMADATLAAAITALTEELRRYNDRADARSAGRDSKPTEADVLAWLRPDRPVTLSQLERVLPAPQLAIRDVLEGAVAGAAEIQDGPRGGVGYLLTAKGSKARRGS